MIQQHLEQLEAEICQIVEQSREGQILMSIPDIGPLSLRPLATLPIFRVLLSSSRIWGGHLPEISPEPLSIEVVLHRVGQDRQSRLCTSLFGMQSNRRTASSLSCTSDWFPSNASTTMLREDTLARSSGGSLDRW
jgi:hypothetical protein